jgi:hypothetical protein
VTPNRIAIAIVACIVLAVAAFYLIDRGSNKTYASPQDVFEASRAAVQRGDMRAWCQCLTDDLRDIMSLIRIVTLTPQEEMTKEDRALAEIKLKHGLSAKYLAGLQPEAKALFSKRAGREEILAFAQKLLQPVRDRNALAADLLQADASDEELAIFGEGKLSDVSMKGNMAVGLVTTPRQELRMVFRKQGEGWRIDDFVLDARAGRPVPPPGFKHP